MAFIAALARVPAACVMLACLEAIHYLRIVWKAAVLFAPPDVPVLSGLLSVLCGGCTRVEKELRTLDEKVVRSPSAAAGAVQGVKMPGLAVFHAVPYATAERFRHARLHTSAADGHFRAAFPRPWYVPGWVSPRVVNTNPTRWTPIAATAAMAFTEQPMSFGVARLLWSKFTSGSGATWGNESQALQLTVHQPLASASGGSALVDKLRPVLVFIHGGAFVTMSQHMPLHRCENLARQTGCVVVSINYRMGVLGFAGFDDPAAGADANCGLVDCETALRWVQRYAHNFGGDAGKVTIMGQSAGSMLCNSLMAMPRCKGLFRNAVLVSGIAQFTKNEADARATLRRLARRMGLADPDDQADLARGLRNASLNELMRLQKSVEDEFQRDFRNFVDMQEQRLAFCPRVELSTLPQHPVDAAFERPDLAADRTIVISTTTAEYNFFLVLAGFVKGVEPLDDSRADRRIRHLFGHERCSAEKAAEIVDAYASTRGRNSGQGWHVHGSHDTAGVWSEACSDVFFRLPSETFADAVAEAGGNAVVCRFAEPAAFPGKFQAAHAVDLHYWLGNRYVPPYFNGLMPFGAHARRFDQVSGTMVELVGDVCWGRHVSAPVWRKRGDGPRGPVMIFGDPAALKNPEGAPVARVADTCEVACAGDDARTAVWDDLTQLARERTTVQASA